MSFHSVHSSSQWMSLTAQNMAQLFTIHPSYHATEELLQSTGKLLPVVHQNYSVVLMFLLGCWAKSIIYVNIDTVLLPCNCSETTSPKQLSIQIMDCTSYQRLNIISTTSVAVIPRRSVVWSVDLCILLTRVYQQYVVSIGRMIPFQLAPFKQQVTVTTGLHEESKTSQKGKKEMKESIRRKISIILCNAQDQSENVTLTELNYSNEHSGF